MKDIYGFEYSLSDKFPHDEFGPVHTSVNGYDEDQQRQNYAAYLASLKTKNN